MSIKSNGKSMSNFNSSVKPNLKKIHLLEKINSLMYVFFFKKYSNIKSLK